MKEKLLIIDGNSLLNRAFYGIPLLTNNSGLYTNAVYGFCNILIKFILEQKPTHVVVALDYGKKTFRHEIFEGYKAGRHETPPELKQQFPILKEVLTSMHVPYIEKENIEADDIIGTLCSKFNQIDTIVITGDRDSFQLIDKNTTVWFMRKGISDVICYDEQKLYEDYSLLPSQIVDYKAIMGDASDRIPGVKGIGEKGAIKLLQTYGSLNSVYENIDSITGTLKNKLIAEREMAYLSYELATIKCDCELGHLEIDDLKLQFPFSSDARSKFSEYNFSSLLKRENLFDEFGEDASICTESIIETTQQFNQLMQKVNASSFVAIDYSTYFKIAIDKQVEYTIKVENNLFNDNLNQVYVIAEIGKILKNVNIEKYVFDCKLLRHKLKEYNLNIINYFDCALAQYLLEGIDKTFNAQSFCDFYGIDSLVVAMTINKDQIVENLKKDNLYSLYKDVELPLSEVLYQMEINGVCLNTKLLDEFDKKYTLELNDLLAQIDVLAGEEKVNINSPKQLGEYLFDKLKLPTLGNKKKSTAVEFLANLEPYHPIVGLILRYRKIAKLKSTYVDVYKKLNVNGVIYTNFNQTGTATGRLSSKDPNLQNIPSRDSETSQIREIFISRFTNGKLISCDYNQIELKLVAHFSGDPSMIEAFNNGKDIHRATAAKIFGVNEDLVTKEMRSQAKTVNFGVIYGQTAYGLSNQLKISLKSANDFILNYFESFPLVKKYMDDSIQFAKENNNYAYTMFNRRRKIKELNSSNYALRQFGERVAMNTPLQGTASDILKIAMVQISYKLKKLGLKAKMIIQIHDELVFDCPLEEVEQVTELVKTTMENVVKLSVPLTVSVNVGDNLSK